MQELNEQYQNVKQGDEFIEGLKSGWREYKAKSEQRRERDAQRREENKRREGGR